MRNKENYQIPSDFSINFCDGVIKYYKSYELYMKIVESYYNINNKINSNNINYNNLLNRLYLINNLIESLEVELDNLDNDNQKLFNKELDNNVKKIIRDENYSKNVLKPFLPYILLYSIYNIDEY